MPSLQEPVMVTRDNTIVGGILISIGTGLISFLLTNFIIPKLNHLFLAANLSGKDLNKRNNDYRVPEGVGVIAGAIFLVCLFFMIPFYVLHSDDVTNSSTMATLSLYLSALLSICCMILLGFADDVLNLQWRHKLLLPTVASLPILMVYYVTYGNTVIVVPIPLQSLLSASVLDLGILYYVYMGMLAVFSTNAINILAGVNGVECGQSIVIAGSIFVNSLFALYYGIESGMETGYWTDHLFCMYLVCPFIGVSAAVIKYNWYPSAVFVGDTYCYFAGMTFAVLGILGHFSKTMMLFFIPQIINFIISVPQLFKLVPCPRHRLPRLHPEKDVLTMSTVVFKQTDLNIVGKIILSVFKAFHLTKVSYKEEDIIVTNFTILNVLLRFFGEMHEMRLTMLMLGFQVICSLMAFLIRYKLVYLFYDNLFGK